MSTIYDPTGGTWLDSDSLAHVYTWNADGTIATDTATYGTSSWTKTYSYENGLLTAETAWVKQ
ncbi:hypothetical protein F3J14_01195 [Burkholderia sp. Tr-862]|uniref:hypothetical protein n=1 Tax=Burkholderia sp. Tr-862 TaxID=2608331 RepID=UPI0014193C79|nr:hypothetical protein [Burkholderia sp. Tr-862]NIF39541.1 hypothetical protein [Burkholderia sp. Tr-862]